MLSYTAPAFGQESTFESPIPEFKFGMSSKNIKEMAKDVSNPEALDELIYKPTGVFYFKSKRVDSVYLTFHYNRLSEVQLFLPNQDWEEFAAFFKVQFGPIWNTSDSISESKHCRWGTAKQSVGMFQNGETLTISYTDEDQKEFQVMDLFTSSFVYIFLIIIGLWFLWWLFAKLYTSYCPKCKSFSMHYVSGGRGEGKNYNPDFLKTDTRLFYDMNYTYKCKKCKYVRHDKYSGYWAWVRSRNEN
jgi:hypothetical protein